MSMCNISLRLSGKVMFFCTLCIGITIIVLCFLNCPLLLQQLRNDLEFNYKYLLYALTAFSLWSVLLTLGFCLWRRNEVMMWFYNGQTTECNEETRDDDDDDDDEEQEEKMNTYSNNKMNMEIM